VRVGQVDALAAAIFDAELAGPGLGVDEVPSAVKATPSITAATAAGLSTAPRTPGPAASGLGGAGPAGAWRRRRARSVPRALLALGAEDLGELGFFWRSARRRAAWRSVGGAADRRITSIITAMPRWTSSSLVARTMPKRPIGSALVGVLERLGGVGGDPQHVGLGQRAHGLEDPTTASPS
jgi:hypothetical protein